MIDRARSFDRAAVEDERAHAMLPAGRFTLPMVAQVNWAVRA
jgi:hypothetical protein